MYLLSVLEFTFGNMKGPLRSICRWGNGDLGRAGDLSPLTVGLESSQLTQYTDAFLLSHAVHYIGRRYCPRLLLAPENMLVLGMRTIIRYCG